MHRHVATTVVRALDGDEGDARIVRGELALLGLLTLRSANAGVSAAAGAETGASSLV